MIPRTAQFDHRRGQETGAILVDGRRYCEFSCILGGMALVNGLRSQDLYGLILAGAMLSVVISPFSFRWYDRKIKEEKPLGADRSSKS